MSAYPCCCDDIGEPCSRCLGTTPAEVTIEITGVVDGDCVDCDDFNATFVLPQDADTCCWLLNPTPCTTEIFLCFLLVGTTNLQVDIRRTDIPVTDGRFFDIVDAGGADVDCSATYNPPQTTVANDQCDWTGATCQVNP